LCDAVVAKATITAHYQHRSMHHNSSTSHRMMPVRRRNATGLKEWAKTKCWCACFPIIWSPTSTSLL